MESLKILKRDGREVDFDKNKIVQAISKANMALKNPQLSKEQIEEIADYIEYKCAKSNDIFTVEQIQDLVENQIMATGAHDLARAYVRYRYEHMNERKLVKLPTKEEKESLKDLKIRKKSGTIVNYSSDKIIAAVSKSAERARASKELTDEEKVGILSLIEISLISFINKNKKNATMPIVSTETMHTLVESALEKVAPDVGDAYSRYHSFRMSQAASWEHVMGKCTTLLGDDTSVEAMTQKNQNANADATLASTMKCFFADYTTEEYYNEFFLTKEEKQIAEDGYLYWHDKNGRMIYPLNCCLFDMGYVLEHGFEINGVWYNQPKTLDVAFDVLGDLTLMSASQQYGGFTVPRIDSILAPYAEKSFKMYKDKYLSLGVNDEKAEEAAIDDIQREMEAGFQGLEYKFNTVASSRGDYPFTTITFGLDTSRFGRMASITALKVRMKGQGKKGKKKPVLFPKLTFLYDKNLHSEGRINNDIYEIGIECSSKTMYPDWLSLTGEGYIPSMYKKYGIKGVISLMGCRASLSPYYVRGGFNPVDDEDYPIFEGRFNLGVISLNLPMILAKARKEDKDFYEVLTYYLEVVRANHKRTREYIGHMKASRNPMGFCYGGFYGGHLKPEEEIAPVLEYSTMSYGITALNELQQLYNGKSLVEDGEFALEVMKYINDYVNRIKKEDHILYAIYGTPAENLCGKQVRQFRAKYGIVKNVSDREYVSNSFHCHVTEDITPFQKQDLEYRFWDYFNGGKIQYCRYSIGYNLDAIKTLVNRAMDMGFYEGVNLSLCFCDDCGHKAVELGTTCPKCGGVHITQIDRMNGYLSFTRVGSDTREEVDDNGHKIITIHSRYSPHKIKEISERKSM